MATHCVQHETFSLSARTPLTLALPAQLGMHALPSASGPVVSGGESALVTWLCGLTPTVVLLQWTYVVSPLRGWNVLWCGATVGDLWLALA